MLSLYDVVSHTCAHRYDLTEFTEALEHAEAPGRSTKVLLNLQPTNAL